MDFSIIISTLSCWWNTISPYAIIGLKSNLSVAFFSSLSGAFGGAIAAQRVIEKSKKKEIFLKELRDINAAIMVSFSICNSLMALKRQHSLPLYEQYTKDRAKALDLHSKLANGKEFNGEPFQCHADLKTFSAPSMPIETLKNLVFNNISSHGKALSAMSYLEGAYNGLEQVLEKRESIISKLQSGTINSREIEYLYFGLPMPSGNINQEYPDVIEAINSYVNDVIFFSCKISEDLASYGNQLREKNKELAKKSPKVNQPDFSGPHGKKLMPPNSDYASWLSSFKEINSKDSVRP